VPVVVASTRCASSRTARITVSHDTPNDAATEAIERLSPDTSRTVSARALAVRQARGGTAVERSRNGQPWADSRLRGVRIITVMVPSAG
jgi:hypothetical protein